MIKICYNKEQELKDLAWIYGEYGFFVKTGYKVYYPKISDSLAKKLIADSNSTENKKILKTEFAKIFAENEQLYKKTLLIVSRNWRKIEKKFFYNLEKIKGVSLKDISCFVSLYGPGGTFYPDNKISIRVIIENESDVNKANEKIAHEVAHLAIHKLSVKYKLNFENTERLADLILNKTPIAALLNNPKMQGFGDKQLDELFGLYPNDLQTLLKEFVRLRK